mmetsp:Transcript_12909/g.40953  ORF Transcript_12909/g.40953 Transcript_12909/m.40953 type:complete len:307 (-) Transcript_12909:203-1123(-)|eukprot:CAMPEP_0197408700 /NCGR_PEP_ID=MMETSP1165-20131217/28813_1 /TAXON_ID=284809 /ORGANISM="Chrysocystis fragilis, Strain CCMP3189" /LENGTH=306 /DNA_ID=CAMNT_0042935135 /DNA_START=45 /DNA_END=965 /DNA_ORIENTATION=-
MCSLRCLALLSLLVRGDGLLDTSDSGFEDLIEQCLLEDPPATCPETIDFLANDQAFADLCTVRRANQLDDKCISACDVVPEKDWCEQLCSSGALLENAATCARVCNIKAGPTDGPTPDYCVTLVDALADVNGCTNPEADPELLEACEVTEKDFVPQCEAAVSTAGDQLFGSCSKACASFPASTCADAYCSEALNRGLLDVDSPLLFACAQQCALQAGTATPDYCLPLITLFVDEDCSQFYNNNGDLRNRGDGIFKEACVLTRNTLGVVCENQGLYVAIDQTLPPCDFSALDPANPSLCDAFPLDYC